MSEENFKDSVMARQLLHIRYLKDRLTEAKNIINFFVTKTIPDDTTPGSLIKQILEFEGRAHSWLEEQRNTKD